MAHSSWSLHPSQLPRLREWYLHSGSLPARLTRAAYRAVKRRYQAIRTLPFRRALIRNLRLLHDVLATTELSDRYWVCGGMLVGWAREGRLLLHDVDADFGILPADRAAFVAAMPRLVAAGFRPLYRFTSNAGEATEYSLIKDGAKFEFFVFTPTDEGLEYFVYHGFRTECRCTCPAHGLAPMPFLGRTWQKPDDHDAYLTAVYGPWRTPNPYFNFIVDGKDLRETYPWHGTHEWPPGVDGAP